MAGHLLAIDDEREICEFIREVAIGLGYSVSISTESQEFRPILRRETPDIVVLDLMMPGVDGVEILRQMAEDGSQAQVVILSGTDARVLQAAKRLGEANNLKMLGVLEKPISLADLRAVLAKGLPKTEAITETSLRAAIENGELVVHYQPKIDLKMAPDWRVHGTEALVRWKRPGSGLVYPDSFIPLAEEAGLIGALTDVVLATSVAQVAAWGKLGFDLSVSVNLSRALLDDLSLPNRIGDLLAEHGLAANRLTLEITETGVMEDAVRTMEILTRFRLKGFGLSIDDFGTGYSSLVQLHRMPFNEIKIDKSFTIEMDEDAEAKKIVTSIAELAQSIGVSLCAEGVETQSALDYLRSIRCETAQGYFFSKPVDPERFLEFLNR
jgi:EAL domain-containing protein (putative c-di-GMP-specific phosphodiesterase class I)/ActR/RegA family two-component response regulator